MLARHQGIEAQIRQRHCFPPADSFDFPQLCLQLLNESPIPYFAQYGEAIDVVLRDASPPIPRLRSLTALHSLA